MKHHLIYLLLIVSGYGCVGNSKALLKKSPYDADFRYYSERLEGKKKKAKHIKKMETAYQLAQKADLIAADSLLNLDKADRWLYINAYHRRIKQRQEKVLTLLPLETKDGYKPDLLIIDNITARESASRQASANYLYHRSEDLLASEAPADARESYRMLTNLKENYYADWENSSELLADAARLGVEHVLVDAEIAISPAFIDSRWQKFYNSPNDRESFDIIIHTRGLNVSVGFDNDVTTTRTESKQIEVDVIEKKDSSGHVIERTPVYETVCATITEREVSKLADANVYVEIIDGHSNALIATQDVVARHSFYAKSVTISGDRRALTFCPIESSFHIFVPSHWEMENKVMDELAGNFNWYIRSHLWTEK